MGNNLEQENNLYKENLKILGRKEIFLEGIKEVINVNENEFLAKLNDCKLYMKGQNFKINKLDLDKEYAQLSGIVKEIKYLNVAFKNLKLKNIFHK